jgi:SHS2 domain-containing protein
MPESPASEKFQERRADIVGNEHDGSNQPRRATFPHDADVGIIGRGSTVEDAIVAAAEATFAEMVDLAAVRPLRVVRISFDEADPEFALVTWLNTCLAESRAAGLALGQFSLRRDGDHWTGEAWGEPWRDDLSRGTEVKGATLTELAVTPVDSGWEARCVVDV